MSNFDLKDAGEGGIISKNARKNLHYVPIVIEVTKSSTRTGKETRNANNTPEVVLHPRYDYSHDIVCRAGVR